MEKLSNPYASIIKILAKRVELIIILSYDICMFRSKLIEICKEHIRLNDQHVIRQITGFYRLVL